MILFWDRIRRKRFLKIFRSARKMHANCVTFTGINSNNSEFFNYKDKNLLYCNWSDNEEIYVYTPGSNFEYTWNKVFIRNGEMYLVWDRDGYKFDSGWWIPEIKNGLKVFKQTLQEEKNKKIIDIKEKKLQEKKVIDDVLKAIQEEKKEKDILI